jgi:hypothetical protein
MNMQRIRYEELNARQQESYNFQQASGILADYGFTTIRLTDDWQGADFIAQHIGGTFLKVQLKGRLTIDRKYQHRDIHICFRSERQWYLYPHDIVMEQILASTNVGNTESWANGLFTFPNLTKELRAVLEPYRLEP